MSYSNHVGKVFQITFIAKCEENIKFSRAKHKRKFFNTLGPIPIF